MWLVFSILKDCGELGWFFILTSRWLATLPGRLIKGRQKRHRRRRRHHLGIWKWLPPPPPPPLPSSLSVFRIITIKMCKESIERNWRHFAFQAIGNWFLVIKFVWWLIPWCVVHSLALPLIDRIDFFVNWLGRSTFPCRIVLNIIEIVVTIQVNEMGETAAEDRWRGVEQRSNNGKIKIFQT